MRTSMRGAVFAAGAVALVVTTSCSAPAVQDQVGFGKLAANLLFTAGDDSDRRLHNVAFLARSDESDIRGTANVSSRIDGATVSFPVVEIRKSPENRQAAGSGCRVAGAVSGVGSVPGVHPEHRDRDVEITGLDVGLRDVSVGEPQVCGQS